MTGVARGGQGNQLRMAVESALGTPGSYHCTRPDSIPNFKANRTLYANHVAGHQHPLTLEKPEALAVIQESAFSADFRIRRATTNGATPDLVSLFESAGWASAVSSGATTLTGTPTVSSLTQTANVTGAGQYVLVERSTGVYVPVLVSALSTNTITPHVRLSAAPSTGAVVQLMHTLTPTTSTGYAVPSNKTLSFIVNTQGFYEDAYGDLALRMQACALASIGEVSFGGVGTIPTLSCTFHGVPVDLAYDDIAADSFVDSSHFGIVTPDFEFSMQAASAAGDIALVSRAVTECTVNFGIEVIALKNEGGTNMGGITGYLLKQGNPTIKITAQFRGDSTFCKKFFSELEGSNTSACIQLIQPTRDLDHPAFAVYLPNAHIMDGGEPVFDITKDVIEASVTYTGSVAGINSGDEIDEIGSAPIIFAISGEAAA